jgi:hypothetical protein
MLYFVNSKREAYGAAASRAAQAGLKAAQGERTDFFDAAVWPH